MKVEFRHLFSLQKRFSLCSSHKINANIEIFCWLTGLQWNNSFLNSKRFGQLLIILSSGLYGLNIKVSFHWSKDLNWHFCGKLFTHLVFLYFQIDWDKENIYFNARDLSCLYSYFLKLYFNFFISVNIIKSVETGIEYDKKLSKPLGI